MKLIIHNEWEFDKIKFNLENPKKGDTYTFYKMWSMPSIGSDEYCRIVISKVEKRNLYYYKNLTKFKIPIDELENVVESHCHGHIEFCNQYEYQDYIEKQKLEQR